MTNVLRLILLFLLSATLAPVAAAQGDENLDKRSFTCPLGGKTFTQEVGYSAFPLITLPDGSWLGDPMMDVQIPICPDNGLVILPDYAAMEASDEQRMTYGDYSVAERARLPGLIADPAYLALKSDNRHAQAYWLATQLGRPASTRFHLLQRSTWATIDPMLRKRRVEQFAADGPALIDAMDETDAKLLGLRLYIVNGLRELGRFDEALTLLDAIESSFPGEGDDRYAEAAIAASQMRTTLAHRDDDRYPVDLLDDRMANDKCSATIQYPPYDQRTTKTREACKRRAAAATKNEILNAALADLRDDPARLDTLCGATAKEDQSEALSIACFEAQWNRDRMIGRDMAMHGAILAPQCEATPETDREGPLAHACVSYDVAIESQLAKLLTDDDEGYGVLCNGDGGQDIPERHRRISGACLSAQSYRHDRSIEAMLTDPAVIDARCTAVPEDSRSSDLADACNRRSRQKFTERLELLMADDTAYRRECARFGDKPRDLFAMDNPSEDEVACDLARYHRMADKGDLAGWTAEAAIGDEVIDLDDASAGDMDYFSDGSELSIAARDAATAIIARAKAENTYPRRPKGQRD